uniref:NADH dehydrogenase subunit 6 n=1 Tax=Lovenula raynerae TaxID=2487506 RepID=A0A3G4YLJ2_9MAXI|nr:NADH dehydrogenase subunit 6 [Lovenula raynerae]
MLQMIFLSLLLMTASISFFLNHPISLALMLMAICVLTSLLILKLSFSWFFFILMLVFLGGVMIIITYMTSLAANEKFFAPSIKPQITLFLSGLTLMIFLQTTSFNHKLSSSFEFTGLLYEKEFFCSLLLCFFSLLLTLISVVKLMKLESGPLVKRL